MLRFVGLILRAAAAVVEVFDSLPHPRPTPSCGLGCDCGRRGLVTRFPAFWIVATGGKFQVVSDRGELVEELDDHGDAQWLRDQLELATRGPVDTDGVCAGDRR